MEKRGVMSDEMKEEYLQRHMKLLHLRGMPFDSETGDLKYTKRRELQTQAGELNSFFCRFSHDSQDKGTSFQIQEIILKSLMRGKINKAEEKQLPLVTVLDASQDDIGARANFGRGNPNNDDPNALDQFLMKVANFQVNRHNQEALEQIFLLGQISIEDLTTSSLFLDPAKPEQRAQLIGHVHEHYQRATDIVESMFKQGDAMRMFYINGDHNNMASVISGWYQGKQGQQKPVVINLDFHSDARKSEDGPHSGTWLSDAYLREEVEHTYIVGLSLLTNSDACIENLENFGVTYLPYTWDEIQMRGGARVALPEITSEIIKDINTKYGPDYPVLFTIDGDTIQGLPCSAQQEVVGYPPEDVYPMVAKFTKELNVQCLSINELKPQLDKTKNNAAGEFLANNLFLYTQTLMKKYKKI